MLWRVQEVTIYKWQIFYLGRGDGSRFIIIWKYYIIIFFLEVYFYFLGETCLCLSLRTSVLHSPKKCSNNKELVWEHRLCLTKAL